MNKNYKVKVNNVSNILALSSDEIQMPKDWHLKQFSIRTQHLPTNRIGPLKQDSTTYKTDTLSKHKRYRSMIATMLSHQNLDEKTAELMKDLEDNKYPLSPLAVDSMDKQQLVNMLNKHRCTNPIQKVINIKKTTRILIEKQHEDIPQSFEEMLTLPGVGPKTASCVYNSHHARPATIAVDTHVHEVAKKLALVSPSSKDAEDTRVQLEKWVPPEIWKELHELLIKHGKWVCKKVDPFCHICKAAAHCPSSKQPGVSKFKFDIEDLDKHVTKNVRDRFVNLIGEFRSKEGKQTKIDDYLFKTTAGKMKIMNYKDEKSVKDEQKKGDIRQFLKQ